MPAPIRSQRGPAPSPLSPPPRVERRGRPAVNTERDQIIRARIEAGEPIDAVALQFKLGPERIRQISMASKKLPEHPTQEVLPPEDEIAVTELPGFDPDFTDMQNGVPAQLSAKSGPRILDTKQRNLLLICARAFCTEGQAAAVLEMSPMTLSRVMKRKDPSTGLTYREIWERGRDAASGRHQIMMLQQAGHMTSWGVQQAQFIAKNKMGWSDKKTEEVIGHMHHTHQRIPDNTELSGMTIQQLESLVGDAVGSGRKRRVH